MSRLPRRVLFYLAAGAVAVTLNFFLPRLMPGDPATTLVATYSGQLTAEDLQAIREAYGLVDAPLWQQFATYLSHLFRGELGVSLSQFPTPVTEVIGTGFGWSLLLGLVSVLLSFAIGSVIGAVAAWRRGSRFDSIAPPVALFAGSFPYFFMALLALYLFAVQWQLLPLGQAYGFDVEPGLNAAFAVDVLAHLVLPAGTVVLVSIGGWVLNMRNTMIGVLDEDYLLMAEAKGLSTPRVVGAYAARNAILPTFTLLGLSIGNVFAGQLLTEVVFSYPGLGYQLYQAVTTHDYPLMQALFLLITVSILVVNLLVDVAYVLLDPRVR
ncbi:ABC transporter permease [Nonomuraea sp. NPDC050663]|uniref:ABC transporter permease n=1 Tax=Nonomuraea sp. NPDC050663 TaxID=3364370 RepID=UPI0037988DAE